MGLNISVKKYSPNSKPEAGFYLVDWEHYDNWDGTRYRYDKEFAAWLIEQDIEERTYPENPSEYDRDVESFIRPKDFEKCAEWVKQNIPEEYDFNRNRWYEIFKAMQEDKNLFFQFNY